MRQLQRIFVMVLFAVSPALAADGVELSLKSRASAVAHAGGGKSAEAPFRMARDPLPELFPADDVSQRGPRGACEHSARDFCYDSTERRIVYRPARGYMPRIDGLQPESVSLRRDRIVFKYSFR